MYYIMRLAKAKGIELWMKNFIKPLACSFLASLLAKMVLNGNLLNSWGLILGITLTTLLYLLILRFCNGISNEEVRWFIRILKRKRKSADT